MIEVSPEDTQVDPLVATVEQWFTGAMEAGMTRHALAVLAALVIALDDANGHLEITVPQLMARLQYTLSIDNPRPGVIRFLLDEGGVDNNG